MDAGDMVQKHNVALFFNGGTSSVPDWIRIRKSTDNTITGNAESQTFDYIDQEAPTSEIKRYAPSLSQPITMYKGEPDYEFAFDKWFNLSTGVNAKTELLVVFYAADATSGYKAWKVECNLVVDNMNPVESVITLTINFNGTVDKGSAVVTNGVPFFTGDTTTEFVMTFTVQVGGVDEEGATVQCGGVTKLTNADGEAAFTLLDGETYTVGATNGTEDAAAVFVAETGTPAITLTLE